MIVDIDDPPVGCTWLRDVTPIYREKEAELYAFGVDIHM